MFMSTQSCQRMSDRMRCMSLRYTRYLSYHYYLIITIFFTVLEAFCVIEELDKNRNSAIFLNKYNVETLIK